MTQTLDGSEAHPSEGAPSVVDGLVPEPTPDEAVLRRTSYFMLFRLGLLGLFTVLAAFTTYFADQTTDPMFEIVAWSTLGLAYGTSLFFAWRLRQTEHIGRLAWAQTVADIMLSALVVQLTGGADSGFAFLYLIAVLGAAVMGDRRQIYVAAGSCLLIYLSMSGLQSMETVLPLRADGQAVRLPAPELWLAVLRTTAAMVAVSVLSAYLNSQLLTSVSQVGSLRALNENIVRSLSSGLLTIDLDGEVLFSNPTAVAILGFGGALTGRQCEDVLPGIDARLQRSGYDRFELTVRNPESKVIDLEINTSPLLDVDGRSWGHVIHFEDVTELRELERRVRRNERLAAIGGLAASVAHEVRNPLAAISGSAELLAGADLGATDQRLLDVIRRESSRLDRTVTDLLSYTRPQLPKLVEADLAEVLRNGVDSFRADPANEAVRVELELPSELVVAVDAPQFSQVLWNLLRNATEAMEGKGTITVRARAAAGHALVEVRDEGKGIDAEDQDRIFEPFFSTKQEGSGIGLALVHKIVEEHGGEIDLDSTPGRGTSVRIELPLCREPSGVYSILPHHRPTSGGTGPA